MSLQFILGSSGAGKSHYLYEKIIKDSMLHPNMEYLVIVPEQFTLQTQKDFVSMHPKKGIMNIDILSFMRLAYRVFDEVGGDDRKILEDTGKTMVVRKVMEDKKDQLSLFKANRKKPGFIDEVKSLLSELFQYSIREEHLNQMIEIAKVKPLLEKKLKDILVIYKGFKEYLSQNYITAEEILDVLYEEITFSKRIQHCVVCFDGFTGFTPAQYKLLVKLMKMSAKVYITVTIDRREDISRLDEEYKLFHLSKKTILKLYKLAADEGVDILDPIYPGDQKGAPYRFLHSKELEALEHNLFRYPYKPYSGVTKDISIHELKNPKQEVFFAIREINRLIREEGYRYRDIAVVSGDINGYGRLIEQEFLKAGLPCFIDQKKDIMANPFIELLRSVLDILRKDFDYESMFRYLRCGLSRMEPEETDQLENYVLALGIRGFKRWREPWTKVYGRDEIELDKLNLLREKALMGLIELRESLSSNKNSAVSYTKALYEFIVKEEIFVRLEHYRIDFEKEKMTSLSKEYEQVYRLVMELFEQVEALLGQEELDIQEFEDLLNTGFSEMEVGFIPPGVDQIVVGDIERTRLKDIKALLFIGVNDGIVPKSGGDGGILSDMEREMLIEQQMELAPTKRQSIYTEQFYLYLNMTKPQNKLYITYSLVGQDGKTVRPSYLIAKLRQLFPDIIIWDEEALSKDMEHIIGADKGITYLLNGLREFNEDELEPIWQELFNWYVSQEEYKDRITNWIEAAFYSNERSNISKTVSELLYGKELTGSVTRLEQYAACAFAHFAAFGLGLSERKEYQIKAPDMGNIFHGALELFSKKLREKKLRWQDITKELREELVSQCVSEITEDFGNTILHSSKRNEYMIHRVERIVTRTTWALCEHMKKGDFEAEGYELSFSFLDNIEATRIPLSEEETLQLMGRIDRLDTCHEEEEIYVKVIDYKSGNTSFDILNVYYGLQLQLMVYLGASMELKQKNYPDKKIVPAGIFYYNIEDPIIDKTEAGGVEESLLKELKMNGLVNSRPEVIKHLDHDFGADKGLRESVKSTIMPVETGKDGSLTKRSNVVNETGFEKLNTFVRDKLVQYAREILSGNTDISPYKLGNRTACDYCSYDSVCAFDKRLPGNHYRNLRKLEKEQVWREFSGEGTVDNGSAEGN